MMGKLRRIRQLLCQHRSGGFGFGRAFICADCGVLVRAGELDLASRVDWAAKRMDQIKSLGSRQISALDFQDLMDDLRSGMDSLRRAVEALDGLPQTRQQREAMPAAKELLKEDVVCVTANVWFW